MCRSYAKTVAFFLVVFCFGLCATCSDDASSSTTDAGQDAGRDAGPSIPGVCGLEGQLVWCLRDLDCTDQMLGNYCNLYGECIDCPQNYCYCDWPGEDCGDPYDPSGYICNPNGKCTNPCITHEDCFTGGACICQNGVSACQYLRCGPNSTDCEPYAMTYPGELACDLKPEYLEGDCHPPTWDQPCDPEFTPIGDHGCIRPEVPK